MIVKQKNHAIVLFLFLFLFFCFFVFFATETWPSVIIVSWIFVPFYLQPNVLVLRDPSYKTPRTSQLISDLSFIQTGYKSMDHTNVNWSMKIHKSTDSSSNSKANAFILTEKKNKNKNKKQTNKTKQKHGNKHCCCGGVCWVCGGVGRRVCLLVVWVGVCVCATEVLHFRPMPHDSSVFVVFKAEKQNTLLYIWKWAIRHLIQMGHCVMVSVWCESLLTNTRFRVLYFRMNNCWGHLMLHQEKELPKESH